jgi:hypothetical protein
MYDGWELLQRLLMAGATPPLGASGGQMWRLMLVACMMIASRQNATELLSNIPSYDVVSLNTGYSADSILNTEQNVQLVLGNDATAVSALRVCQVLLERLGGQHQEPRQQALLSEDLQGMVYKVCVGSKLFRVQPSMVALALVYCLRQKRGLVPLWPAALVQLTGIYDPTVGDLGLVMQQLQPLLGQDTAPAAATAAGQPAVTPSPAVAGAGGAAPGQPTSSGGGAATAAAAAPAGASTAVDAAAAAGSLIKPAGKSESVEGLDAASGVKLAGVSDSRGSSSTGAAAAAAAGPADAAAAAQAAGK